jgi:hypothetical protein
VVSALLNPVQMLALPVRRSLPDMDFGRVYNAAGNKGFIGGTGSNPGLIVVHMIVF